VLGGEVRVEVDQMTTDQALTLLTAGLPPVAPAVVAELLALTGRWALLLRLVNKILRSAARTAGDVSEDARELCARLRTGGPQVTATLGGVDVHALDVNVSSERAEAVRTTIEASTGLLKPSSRS